MKTCDVCGSKLGIMNKFKYADGYVCKECYKKASRQFTETITQKSLEEIKELCSHERDEESFEQFEITGRIGNYLLIDEKNRRLCIPNNRMTNQKVSDPEFYDIEDIERCEIQYHPEMTLEELEMKMVQKEDQAVMEHLNVSLFLKDGTVKRIRLLQKPVRIRSYAFRQSFQFAKRINEKIVSLIGMEG